MKHVLIVFLLMTSTTLLAGTKAELKAQMEATGKFVEVGTPVVVAKQGSVKGLTANQYDIAVLIQSTSTVLVQRSYRIWVTDDGGASEAAFFSGGDPVVTPPQSFRTQVQAYMDSNGLRGLILDTWDDGSIKWASILNYETVGADSLDQQSIMITKVGANAPTHRIVQ